jgi:hypothetical protein
VIPITKNVIVVDEFGVEYEPTYIKRAKGLVKHGRARFISENRICLTRPPDIFSEDKSVYNNINANAAGGTANENSAQFTAREILSRIDKIVEDTSYLNEFFKSWATASDNNEGTLGMQNVVVARETTNQRVLDFLERMYGDISPTRDEEPNNVKAFKAFLDVVKDSLDGDELNELMLGRETVPGMPPSPGALKYFFEQPQPQNLHFNGPVSGFGGFGSGQQKGRGGNRPQANHRHGGKV